MTRYGLDMAENETVTIVTESRNLRTLPFQPSEDQLSTHGTPEQVETDNGPPFTSKEFNDFALQEGFRHHRVTPLHPQANGEAENFMKILNKTEQRARLENKSAALAIQELLTGYRSTPHPATGVTPYEGMMNRQVRTKIDYRERTKTTFHTHDTEMNKRDRCYKRKIKDNAENKNTRRHRLAIGDHVLLEQKKVNKWTSPYEYKPYIVFKIKGSSIWARRITDGRVVCRDSTCFKRIKGSLKGRRPREDSEDRRETTVHRQHRGEVGDWREHALRKAKEGKHANADDKNDDEVNHTGHETLVETQPVIDNAPRRSHRIRQRPQRYGDFLYY